MSNTLAVPQQHGVLGSPALRQRLIEREQSLIQKTEDMLQSVKSVGSYSGYTYQRILRLAKQRLVALRAGLMPVRLGGSWITLNKLVNQGQYVPPEIVTKSVEVRERLPKAQQRVYGWEENAATDLRRRRDPVLVAHIGDSYSEGAAADGRNFFLGFWIEYDIPDMDVPEFFGLTAPLLPKPGRGRPRKIR